MDEHFETLRTGIVVGEDPKERLDRVMGNRNPERRERLKQIFITMGYGDPEKLDSFRQERIMAEREVEKKLAEENTQPLPDDWEGELQPHPLNFFPEMRQKELEGLAEDIRVNGLQEPITLYEGKILDGRARYQACIQVGRELKFEELPDNISPITYVLSKNGNRRHLTVSQRAVVALEYLPYIEVEAKQRMLAGIKYPDPFQMLGSEEFAEEFTLGQAIDHEIICEELDREEAFRNRGANLPQGRKGRVRDIVGESIGVSGRYIGYARKIQGEAPELLKDVKRGHINLYVALRLLKLPWEKRDIAINHIKSGDNPNKVLKDVKGEWDKDAAARMAFRELKIWHKKFKGYKKFEVFEMFRTVFDAIEELKPMNLKWAIRTGKERHLYR
jgi:hypothetical protein